MALHFTLPVLLWTGISPYNALGTNKLVGTFASSTSSFTYFRSGYLHRSLLLYMIPFTFLGALIGVESVLATNPAYLKLLIFFAIICIAGLTLWKRNMGMRNQFAGMTRKTIALAASIAFALGFYDGFIGPGTGSFLLFIFLSVFRFDFITAAGNGRALNFTSNIAALALFAQRGKVIYLLGLPMAVGMMIGARVGSTYAVRKGSKLIRPLFVAAAIVLSLKMGIDVFAQWAH